jgi:aldehyde dehydrogenase (NAD+)
VLKENNLPQGISNLVIGDAEIGDLMAKDTRVPLISATGSTRMGKIVAQNVAARLGKSLLELGGNNAIIVTPDADIKMTVIGAAFRCSRNCWSTLYFYQKINHSRKYVRKSKRRSGCSLRTIKNRKSA